jgi:hypothetical protein
MKMSKTPPYSNMRNHKPTMHQYIHFIKNDGFQSYGWYRGEAVEIHGPVMATKVGSIANALGVLQPEKPEGKPPIPTSEIAAWRPIFIK